MVLGVPPKVPRLAYYAERKKKSRGNIEKVGYRSLLELRKESF